MRIAEAPISSVLTPPEAPFQEMAEIEIDNVDNEGEAVPSLSELMTRVINARLQLNTANYRLRELNLRLAEKAVGDSAELARKRQRAIDEMIDARRTTVLARASLVTALMDWRRSHY